MVEVEMRNVGCSVEYDALVLDAKLRQSLVVLRSLGSRGMCVAALERVERMGVTKHLPGFSSRWCVRAYRAPKCVQEEEIFLTYLQQILQYRGAGVLIASADNTLALLRKYRQELEGNVRIALAKEEALAIACNKERTLEVAERLGLDVPRGIVIRDMHDASLAVREVGLPAVVKPIETWGWDAKRQREKRLMSVLVTTELEVQTAVAQLMFYGNGNPVLFQQYLTGRREAVSFLFAHGTFYARFAQWAQRTQPPLGGTSVLRQSIALPPDCTKQAEKLVQAIDLEGYSEVEFRRDATGKPYLMEINPRLSASVEVAVRAGVDFPYLLYQWANGEKIKEVAAYQTGGWMRHLGGDIVTLVEMMKQSGRPGIPGRMQACYEFFSTFLLPSGYDYLDWHDPMPALTATQTFIQQGYGRIQMRISSTRRMQ